MAPTVAHCVWLPAPRGGRCACGLAKPVPRPLLVGDAYLHVRYAPYFFPFVLSLSKDASREALHLRSWHCGHWAFNESFHARLFI